MNTSSLSYKSNRGFTLIELIVVLAIFGLLLAAAVPELSGYMIKAKRQDATALLSETVLRLERCFTLEGTYNGACTLKVTSEEGYYSLSATREVQTYTLSAVPVAGKSQSKDSGCTAFSITSTGKKSATGTFGNNCW